MTLCKYSKTTVAVLLALLLTAPSVIAENLEGSWRGSFQVGQYPPLELVFHIRESEGSDKAYEATLDIPSQQQFGIQIANLSLRESNLSLIIPQIGADFYGSLRYRRDGRRIDRIEGDWAQSGEFVPLVLRRVRNPQ